MNKSYLFLAILILCVFLGFSNGNISKRTIKTNFTNKSKSASIVNDNNNPISTEIAYYSDDFNAPSDTAALKARGYLVYRNGTFSGFINSNFWFTGDPDRFGGTFPAFNGADSDYVASDLTSGGKNGNIDNWLVLPDLDVVIGDSLCFYSRKRLFNIDSIRVMFNPLGGTLPSSPGWIELGRFSVNTSGVWELRSFVIPSSALNARLAIRYTIILSGFYGVYGDYIGIDALRVQGQGVLPVDLLSFSSVISNNNVILNWSTATETNNSGFDIERSNVKGQTSNEWNKIAFIPGSGTTNSPKNYSFIDRNLNSGNYNYRLKQIDLNGNFEYFNLSNEVVISVPVKFELSQNYPNPFNPNTVISYQLTVSSYAKLKVFDIQGNEVATLVNAKQNAGSYTVELDGSNLPSGIYYYKLDASNFIEVKKMTLIK